MRLFPVRRTEGLEVALQQKLEIVRQTCPSYPLTRSSTKRSEPTSDQSSTFVSVSTSSSDSANLDLAIRFFVGKQCESEGSQALASMELTGCDYISRSWGLLGARVGDDAARVAALLA